MPIKLPKANKDRDENIKVHGPWIVFIRVDTYHLSVLVILLLPFMYLI